MLFSRRLVGFFSVFAASPFVPSVQADSMTLTPEAAAVKAFWTAERLAMVEPLEMHVNSPAPDPDPDQRMLRSRSLAVGNDDWIGGGDIEKSAGRLLIRRGSSYSVCSATVISDWNTPGRSLLITAAHCVFKLEVSSFADMFVFVPNQDDGLGDGTDFSCSNDPFGCWFPEFAVIDRNWADVAWPFSIPVDYAVLVVPDAGHWSPGYLNTNQPALDQAVPNYTVDFSNNMGLQTGTEAMLMGYPYIDDPNFRYCQQPLALVNNYPLGYHWELYGCAMKGGSSGGPGLRDVNSKIYSVVSYGGSACRDGCPTLVMGGPTLFSNSFSCLFNRAMVTQLGSSAGEILDYDGVPCATEPSDVPSSNPSVSLAQSTSPSSQPSAVPSSSKGSSSSPSDQPSMLLSMSFSPSENPSMLPSENPSKQPSTFPSISPSFVPSSIPSADPSVFPSSNPSQRPSISPMPSGIPRMLPTQTPSAAPTLTASSFPTGGPSYSPSMLPTQSPSVAPTVASSSFPIVGPSDSPSMLPTQSPSVVPTVASSSFPTVGPSDSPSMLPTQSSSIAPTVTASKLSSVGPSGVPSTKPSVQPSMTPTVECSEDMLSQTATAALDVSVAVFCVMTSTERCDAIMKAVNSGSNEACATSASRCVSMEDPCSNSRRWLQSSDDIETFVFAIETMQPTGSTSLFTSMEAQASFLTVLVEELELPPEAVSNFVSSSAEANLDDVAALSCCARGTEDFGDTPGRQRCPLGEACECPTTNCCFVCSTTMSDSPEGLPTCTTQLWGDFLTRERCSNGAADCDACPDDCCEVRVGTFNAGRRMLEEEEAAQEFCVAGNGLPGVHLHQEQLAGVKLKGNKKKVCVSACFPIEEALELLVDGWSCGSCSSMDRAVTGQ